ncbi:MAG: non-homologous end-joining DNA ligase [Verrucomicrobiota bacterium]|nr:non-homologous end-joining DNA ligase [Verrucomicrobiota bacterium]
MRSELEVEGKKLAVSNLDKVLYPKAGFTKHNVIEYFIHIAPFLLPHLKNRALTLKRYPNGVAGDFFYEKKCPSHRPTWVKTAPIWSEHNKSDISFCLANDLPTLVWAANLANLELHTSLSKSKTPLKPDFLVFDLDPGPPADIVKCCEVGLELKKLFDGLGLKSFPKTSGSKGLQVYIPLNTPTTYELTKFFANEVAIFLEKKMPEKVVSKMKKSLRTGKVFVDWSQNDNHKTTVCVYSLRAKDQPTASTPVTWEEVRKALKSLDPHMLVFHCHDTLARAQKMGDLFAPVLTLKQKLPPKLYIVE